MAFEGHVYRTLLYESIIIGIMGTIIGTTLGNGTQFKMKNIKFDQEIPEYIFTKAALKQ